MAQHYDRAMKWLGGAYASHLVRLVLGAEALGDESVELEPQDKELPALSREVDFVARVRLHGETALLLLEFQTDWVAEMPRRMAGYTVRLHERHGEPVYPVVVVLRPGGALQGEWRLQAWGRLVASCRCEVVPLWEHDAQAVVAQRLVGLYPLLPLMWWPSTEPQAVLEQSQRLILEQIEPGEAQANAYVALRVLSGIVYPQALVDRILQRRSLMIESPVYQQILEEGSQDRLRRDVLEVLEVRFGPVPAVLATQIGRQTDQELLAALHRRAVVVDSLAGFAQELAAARLPER